MDGAIYLPAPNVKIGFEKRKIQVLSNEITGEPEHCLSRHKVQSCTAGTGDFRLHK